MFDRYAACLAATEGLRRIRDRDLSEEAQHKGYINKGGAVSEGERDITQTYIKNSSRVLKALGMTIQQFNELGQHIAQDDRLREKIMQQAYLYRMAATISLDKMPLIQASDVLEPYPKDKVQRFTECMTEIEQLRGGQIERLKRSLHVNEFPGHINISDESLLPFLSPKVRAVVEAFPLQAQEIVERHGLESDEFNQMLQETKTNPIFRWKIEKKMKIDPEGESPFNNEQTYANTY
jgi:hypothetical protein